MEDAHIAATRISSCEDTCLFAVFDGHGGSEVAKFCAKHMRAELESLASFRAGDYDSALTEVFHRMDTMLLDEAHAPELAAVRTTVALSGTSSNVVANPFMRVTTHAFLAKNLISIASGPMNLVVNLLALLLARIFSGVLHRNTVSILCAAGAVVHSVASEQRKRRRRTRRRICIAPADSTTSRSQKDGHPKLPSRRRAVSCWLYSFSGIQTWQQAVRGQCRRFSWCSLPRW